MTRLSWCVNEKVHFSLFFIPRMHIFILELCVCVCVGGIQTETSNALFINVLLQQIVE